jgi:hypothetical protein
MTLIQPLLSAEPLELSEGLIAPKLEVFAADQAEVGVSLAPG